MRLVSACLLGVKCAWNGESKENKEILNLLGAGEVLIPVCPEQLGGLQTPRVPSERKGNIVINREGKDMTSYFIRGAQETLRICNLYGVSEVILKEKSPSCGVNRTYDGTFSDTLVEGKGVTTELLESNGIKVISSEEI